MSEDYTPDREEVLEHAATMALTAQVINTVSAYLSAPDDTEEERAHEDAMVDMMNDIGRMPMIAVQDLVLSLVTLICTIGDEEQLQAYFDFHAAKVKGALE
jgi:hypothetical protein